MNFLSVDEIVIDIPKKLCGGDIKYFTENKSEDFVSIQMEETFKRWIRNHYKLWDENNPFTLKDYVPEIINNADYNPKHPDNLSDVIYKKFIRSLKG